MRRFVTIATIAISSCTTLLMAFADRLLGTRSASDGSQCPRWCGPESLWPGSASSTRPLAWLGAQRVLVAAEGAQWVAVVGLDLATTPGTYELRVHIAGESQQHPFAVVSKDYPAQRITQILKDSSKVQLLASDLTRVEG